MNVFELTAMLTLNSTAYKQGLKDSENEAQGFGTKLARGLGKAGAAVGSAMAAGVAAAGALAKSAVNAYAEYEQLVGGVETLFGKSASAVKKYAEQAYKTAGLSANEYMETVTGFSASLLQSLGGDTAAAADYADKAIRDMADNANKMGSSMASIQNAYQGFAKQNYTMLDNLKLGYGGTASEMKRLILDAEELNSTFQAARDENGELAMSYADIVDAIHIVQDSMGITGTTAKEASETIKGSVASMKSAWENLVVAIASGEGDMSEDIENFTETATTMAKNVIPRFREALRGISGLVEGLAPVIGEELPRLVTELGPELGEAALGIIESLVEGLLNNLPALVESSITILNSLTTYLSENLPIVIPAVVDLILTIVQGLIDNLPLLNEGAVGLLVGLIEGIIYALPQVVDRLPALIVGIVDGLLQCIPQLIDAGIRLFVALVDNLPAIIEGISDSLPKLVLGIVDAIINNLPLIIEAGFRLFVALIQNLPAILEVLVTSAPQIIEGLVKAFIGLFGKISGVGGEMGAKAILGFLEGGKEKAAELWEKIKDVGANFLRGLWQGIKDNSAKLWEKIKGWLNDLWGNIKSFFGIKSPSRLFRDDLGKNLMRGFADGIDKYGDYGVKAIDEWSQRINDAVNIAPINAELSAGGIADAELAEGQGSRSGLTVNIYAQKLTPAQVFEEARKAEDDRRFMRIGDNNVYSYA